MIAELSPNGDRIDVRFPYSPEAVRAAKSVPGARFVPADRGGPLWRYPLSLTSGRRLREAFGLGLVLGPELTAWGTEAVRLERNLGAISGAESAELVRLPVEAPALYEFVSSRPYQTADIAMMAATNVLNANQPGTGKTVEVLGAWVEAGLLRGRHLVVAPKSSLEVVWKAEIERFFPEATVVVLSGSRKPTERALAAVLTASEEGSGTRVLVTTPDALRSDSAGIGSVAWSTCTIDEFHRFGLGNPKTKFAAALRRIRAERKYALSGTPIGGKPIRMWGVLNWLEPNEYTSKWAWAESWLRISDNGFGKEIGGIVPGREGQFVEAHARHMVRRLKREALPGLPEKVRIEVTPTMTPKQAQAYEAFRRDLEVRLAAGDDGEERVAAENVLAEFTRLKQFANALCEVDETGTVVPTGESGKLDELVERLDAEGIRRDDPVDGARAIVASESRKFVEVVAARLRQAYGDAVDVDLLTGETGDDERVRAVHEFGSDDGRARVLVLTTTAGGVSLNLEAANSIHVLDETWNPDDTEQLEDRGDRGSRTEPLRVYLYRTKETIQEYVARVADGKTVTNRTVLDYVRQPRIMI